MSDASSIRRVTSPVAPPAGQPGPVSGVLAPESQVGSGFYEGAIRFLLNAAGYNYVFIDNQGLTKSRKTGQAFINTGYQWAPVGNKILNIEVGATPTDLDDVTAFIADRPYNVASVQGVVSTAAGSAATVQLYSAPAGPTVTISGPGTGAIAIPVVSAGVITSFTVTNGGSGYGTVASAVTVTVTGTNTTAAVVGAVTLSGGAITAIAVTSGGTGYVSPTAIGSGTPVSSPLNFNVTANIVQPSTLSSTIANTQIATGARLGLVFTGAASSAVGLVTVVLQPQ